MSAARVLIALAASGVAALLLLSTGAAVAVESSSIEFDDTSPISADFGSDWSTKLTVNLVASGVQLPAPPSQGTVDVFLDGFEGPWASGLPVGPDGSVYVAQPLAQPLLPAGSYSMSAVFVPSAAAFLQTSQTTVPLTLTITPLSVDGAVAVIPGDDPSRPTIVASLTGAYVDATGGSPAGTWSFTMTDPEGGLVLEAELAVEMGEKHSIRVQVPTKLAAGKSYTLSAIFEPVAQLAGGLTVASVPSVEYRDDAETAAASVAVPLWVVIAVGIVMVGLATSATILALWRRPARPATDLENHDPSDPAILDS